MRILASAALCLLLAQPAHAALILVALPGNVEVLRDTETALDWLTNRTPAYSYQQIIAGAGGYLADGWH